MTLSLSADTACNWYQTCQCQPHTRKTIEYTNWYLQLSKWVKVAPSRQIHSTLKQNLFITWTETLIYLCRYCGHNKLAQLCICL